MSPFQWWLRYAQNLALVINLTEGRAVLSRVLASLFVLPFIQDLGVTPGAQRGGLSPEWLTGLLVGLYLQTPLLFTPTHLFKGSPC